MASARSLALPAEAEPISTLPDSTATVLSRRTRMTFSPARTTCESAPTHEYVLVKAPLDREKRSALASSRAYARHCCWRKETAFFWRNRSPMNHLHRRGLVQPRPGHLAA